MKFYRIKGLIIRYMYEFRRSLDKYMEILLFPVIDLLLWGMTSEFFRSSLSSAGGNNAVLFVISIVSSIIFWSLASRTSSDIPFSLLDDLWSRNLINLFGSPLTLPEWVTAAILSSLIKALFTSTLLSVLALIFYKVSILHFGFALFPFVLLLTISGLWISFFVTALIMKYGQRIQSLAWSFGAIMLPFSAIYYPVSTLPHFVQKISWLLPLTYLFEASRAFVFGGGIIKWSYLLACLLLNLVYIGITGVFLNHTFKARLRNGILKLQN